MILNLTPHPVRVFDAARQDGLDDLDAGIRYVINPESVPARLATIELGRDGSGAELVEYGHATGLPRQQDGVRYVVSLVVALALAGRRPDLLVPYREVRDSSGTVIGCRALAQPV